MCGRDQLCRRSVRPNEPNAQAPAYRCAITGSLLFVKVCVCFCGAQKHGWQSQKETCLVLP